MKINFSYFQFDSKSLTLKKNRLSISQAAYLNQLFTPYLELHNRSYNTLQIKVPKKILAELVFLYIDSILLRNQDWLIDWVEFNQHCRSWRLRLRATPIWKMLQCTMEPKSFWNNFWNLILHTDNTVLVAQFIGLSKSGNYSKRFEPLCTLPTPEILSGKNARPFLVCGFLMKSFKKSILKLWKKIVGAVWKLPTKLHSQSSPFSPKLG